MLLYQYVPIEYSVTSCDGNVSEVVKTFPSITTYQIPIFDNWSSPTTVTGTFNKRVNLSTNIFTDYVSEYTANWETWAISDTPALIGNIYPAFYYEKSANQNNYFNITAIGTIPGTELDMLYAPGFTPTPFTGTLIVGEEKTVYDFPEDVWTPRVMSQSNPSNVVQRIWFKNAFYIPGAEPVCRCPDEIKVNENIIITPTITNGTGSIYTVSPKLPTGLTLNMNTGVISGSTSQVKPLTTYTITAATCKGSTSFDLTFRVR
jgi:hypothetical protein